MVGAAKQLVTDERLESLLVHALSLPECDSLPADN